VASDCRRRMGGDVCNFPEPPARRSTRWRAHPVFGVSTLAQMDFTGRCAGADSVGKILLVRLGALGSRPVADGPASFDSEASVNSGGAKVFRGFGGCDVGIGVHTNA